MCSLMLQIIDTRLLSVISWYYLAFCAISMAMFGMTAGSLLIYFNAGRFKAERMLEHLSWISWGFALAIAGSGLMIISTVILSVTGTAMLALSDLAGERLADARTGKNGRHALVGMLRQAVFGRLAGYEDVNDAERLRHDPAMRWIVGGKAAAGCAASASQMGRLETRWLASGRNLSALADLSGQWIDKVHARRPPRGVVLDMDSSVSPTHGEQEMSVWNGHYECTCYHPLFVFNQFGDLERCALRPGNVHSADGWEGVLKPVVARYRGKVSRIYFRADAGFANPDVYEFLETERIKYAC
jgi:hypothetical protein